MTSENSTDLLNLNIDNQLDQLNKSDKLNVEYISTITDKSKKLIELKKGIEIANNTKNLRKDIKGAYGLLCMELEEFLLDLEQKENELRILRSRLNTADLDTLISPLSKTYSAAVKENQQQHQQENSLLYNELLQLNQLIINL